jgi:hypothetical protein
LGSQKRPESSTCTLRAATAVTSRSRRHTTRQWPTLARCRSLRCRAEHGRSVRYRAIGPTKETAGGAQRVGLPALAKAAPGLPPKMPLQRDPASTDLDTSYVCVVDRHGNAFSATPSDGLTSSPAIPELGFVASPRGSQSWTDPQHPSCIMGPAAAADAEPSHRDAQRQVCHAVWNTRAGHADSGYAAGAAERRGIRDGAAGGGGSATVRIAQLPFVSFAASLSAWQIAIRAGGACGGW